MKAISKVIITHNDKYLLYLRDNKPEISFSDHRDLFGGGVEEGESPEQGAIRELQEELSISIDPSELNFIEAVSWDTLECHVYQYEMPESLLDNLVLGEGQKMRRYTQSEIQGLKLVHWYRKYFMKKSFSKQDFDQQGEQKYIIHKGDSDDLYFKEGEVWWCTVGINEALDKGADFRRPVLILKKLSSELFVAIPLDSQKREGTRFCEYEMNNEKGYAMLYKIRRLERDKLQRKIGRMKQYDFLMIKKKLKELLGL